MELLVRGLQGAVGVAEGAVEKEDSRGGEEVVGVSEEVVDGVGGGDVDHVDGDDGDDLISAESIFGFDGGEVVEEIEGLGGPEVGEVCLFAVGGDALQGVGAAGVGGLPGQVGKAVAEGDGVLAGAASHLQDQAGLGEELLEDVADGALVAAGGFGEELHGFLHGFHGEEGG